MLEGQGGKKCLIAEELPNLAFQSLLQKHRLASLPLSTLKENVYQPSDLAKVLQKPLSLKNPSLDLKTQSLKLKKASAECFLSDLQISLESTATINSTCYL